MPLPNLIVIGAMKCGTTSLHDYLGRHPQVAMSANKEVKFFSSERAWGRGVKWYESQFAGGTDIRGESSPSYTARLTYPGVPERMHSVIPDAKLLYIVRDPVERLISHWVQRISLGTEARPLAQVVQDERFIDPSLYWTQISMFLELFSPSQIHVIATEDLASDRRLILRSIFEFLAVDADFYSSAYEVEKHPSSQKRIRTRLGTRLSRSWLGRGVEALPQRLRWPARELLYRPFSKRLQRPVLVERDRAFLIDRMREDINQFREFAGREFSSWSV